MNICHMSAKIIGATLSFLTHAAKYAFFCFYSELKYQMVNQFWKEIKKGFSKTTT